MLIGLARRFKLTLVLLLFVLLFCVSCGRPVEKSTWQYGYKDLVIWGDWLQPPILLNEMYSDPKTTAVLIVYTRTPLEQREVYPDFKEGEVVSQNTFTDCIVLDVIRDQTADGLSPGDPIVLGEGFYMGKRRGEEGGMETVLVRNAPYCYPIDTGHPYLVICRTIPISDEPDAGIVCWPWPYGIFDVSDKDPTSSENGAMTAKPGSSDADEYRNVLTIFSQKKAAAVTHADFTPWFEKYAGKVFD